MLDKHLPVVVVLAAGAGQRFRAEGGSGSKLQADLLGRPVLEWTLDAVRASGLPWLLVQRPEQGAEHLGMGDSIARGVAQSPQAPGWLILPGDMPLMQATSLKRVALSLQMLAAAQPRAIVRPEIMIKGQARPGHPVGFGPAWKNELLALAGDTGAIELVRRAGREGWLERLACSELGCIQDIDRPADIAAAASRLQEDAAGSG